MSRNKNLGFFLNCLVDNYREKEKKDGKREGVIGGGVRNYVVP